MSAHEAACTRVYASHGKMAHLLAPWDSPNAGYPAALCGLRPRLFAAWLGTGSQREHERAASLPLCGRCGLLAPKPKPEPPEDASDHYRAGWADGMAGKDPEIERMALGANRMNDYERGYVDSGEAPRDGDSSVTGVSYGKRNDRGDTVAIGGDERNLPLDGRIDDIGEALTDFAAGEFARSPCSRQVFNGNGSAVRASAGDHNQRFDEMCLRHVPPVHESHLSVAAPAEDCPHPSVLMAMVGDRIIRPRRASFAGSTSRDARVLAILDGQCGRGRALTHRRRSSCVPGTLRSASGRRRSRSSATSPRPLPYLARHATGTLRHGARGSASLARRKAYRVHWQNFLPELSSAYAPC